MGKKSERKKHRSLKTRITIWYAIFMLILTASFLILLMMISGGNTDESIQTVLINTVQTISAQIDGTRRIDLRELLEDEIDNQVIAIYSSRGFMLAGDEPDNLESICEFEDDAIQSVIAGGSVYYVYDQRVDLDGDHLWVRGYVRMLTAREAQRSFLYLGICMIPLLAVVMTGGGYLLTRRALKPLNDMIAEMSEIVSADNLDRRVPVPDSEDELYALGTSMNTMLTKLEDSFAREKQFVSDASHELRTPIAVILAQCELAGKETDEAALKKGFSVVERQSRRMKNLIEDLLQLSRMESGRIKPDFSEVNLSSLVGELIEEQEIIHPGEDTVDTAVEDGMLIFCDAGLVERAFRNLIINAHQYGGGFYRVELYERDGDIIFSVKDHGKGIPPENLDKIWNRFYRGDMSRRFQGGYGLGLPMVKDISAMHGWSIHVSSAENSGSEFQVIIKRGKTGLPN